MAEGTGNLREQLERLQGSLDGRKFDYVIARSKNPNINKALKEARVGRGWYYGLTDSEREELEQTAESLRRDWVSAAWLRMAENSMRAVDVLFSTLDLDDQRFAAVRRQAAQDILGWVMQKPVERSEVRQPGMERLAADHNRLLEAVYGADREVSENTEGGGGTA